MLEADINNYKSKILKILSDCAVKMPEKTTIYTTLVGLLNAKNYNFGGEVGVLFNYGTAISICICDDCLCITVRDYTHVSLLSFMFKPQYQQSFLDLHTLLPYHHPYSNCFQHQHLHQYHLLHRSLHFILLIVCYN